MGFESMYVTLNVGLFCVRVAIVSLTCRCDLQTDGAILAPHVDRNPLVSSAIINVDQDVDEPWPLEVIGHDGIAVNITMEPGDLVLYER
jgi:hypothetical protein